MIIRSQEGLPLPIYGEGKNVRDWIQVLDHCRAIDLILRKGRPGEIYNVGGNTERQNIEVAHEVLQEMGRDDSLIEYVQDRPGHDLRYAIDSTKIKNELGWSPSLCFKEGIKQTVHWYIENEKWWKPLMQYAGRHGLDRH